MTDVAGLNRRESGGKASGGKRGILRLAAVLAALLIVAGAGFGGWYFFLGGKAYFSREAQDQARTQPEPPFFVEVKPFVTTARAADGSSHFIQLGVNLKVGSQRSAEAVTSVVPELQDTIRGTVLPFKLEELETVDGVERMRAAVLDNVNAALVRALGETKVRSLAGSGEGGGLVRNVYFSNLVIE